jgi:hypothetical protein
MKKNYISLGQKINYWGLPKKVQYFSNDRNIGLFHLATSFVK